MQKTSFQVLSTRPLTSNLVTLAASNDIILEEVCFIQTETLQSQEVNREIRNYLQQIITVVFTSMNAVDAVAKHINEKPGWNIYCIGNTTKKLVTKFFGKNSVCGTAESAEELAEIIILDGVEHLVFFCGDQRRDELPSKLKAQKIIVEEVVVYITHATPTHVEKKFDGILFFSPSAVESFFSINNITEHTKMFAIGATTAKAIELYTQNNVIISKLPGKENLVKQMINYFCDLKQNKIVQ